MLDSVAGADVVFIMSLILALSISKANVSGSTHLLKPDIAKILLTASNPEVTPMRKQALAFVKYENSPHSSSLSQYS